MLGQLNSNQPAFQLQSELSDWVKIIKPFYLTFVSPEFRNRPNANNGKLSDPLLLALLCWQVDLKITVQTRYYHFLANNIFPRDSLPERSRFNRLCRQAGNALQQIRFGMIKKYVTPTYAIIDSLPLPLCKPVRNLRAKVLKGTTNIGYNSTKKMHYYGFKGSFEVSNDGTVLTYVLTPASVHDINMVTTLLEQFPCKNVIADLGYLSKQLKDNLRRRGINFWTPVRKNMVQPLASPAFLNRKRRRIETTFSQLVNLFDIEEMHVDTESGFQSRLEQCLLVHTLKQLGVH